MFHPSKVLIEHWPSRATKTCSFNGALLGSTGEVNESGHGVMVSRRGAFHHR
jgi:hypothetical protein